MNKIAIVTGSDKNYFPFLKNLVFSLVKSKSLEIAWCPQFTAITINPIIGAIAPMKSFCKGITASVSLLSNLKRIICLFKYHFLSVIY